MSLYCRRRGFIISAITASLIDTLTRASALRRQRRFIAIILQQRDRRQLSRVTIAISNSARLDDGAMDDGRREER